MIEEITKREGADQHVAGAEFEKITCKVSSPATNVSPIAATIQCGLGKIICPGKASDRNGSINVDPGVNKNSSTKAHSKQKKRTSSHTRKRNKQKRELEGDATVKETTRVNDEPQIVSQKAPDPEPEPSVVNTPTNSNILEEHHVEDVAGPVAEPRLPTDRVPSHGDGELVKSADSMHTVLDQCVPPVDIDTECLPAMAECFITWDTTNNGEVFIEYNKTGPVKACMIELEGGKIPGFKFVSGACGSAGRNCTNRQELYRCIVSVLKTLKRQGSAVKLVNGTIGAHPFKLVFLINGATHHLDAGMSITADQFAAAEAVACLHPSNTSLNSPKMATSQFCLPDSQNAIVGKLI